MPETATDDPAQDLGQDPGERLLRRETYEHADRECDVIMKGGITSGVLYPLAVCELASTYRLRNVGGTSAGAIAAAAAAAAEHGRESGASGSGFTGLASLPQWLGTDKHLVGLFRPPATTRRLHGLLMRAVRPGAGKAGVVGAVVAAGVGSHRAWMPVLGALPGLLLVAALLIADAGSVAAWLGVVVALVLASVGLVVGAAVAVVLDAGEALDQNMYGIVAGSAAHDGGESLSDWLADQIDTLAGRPVAGPPLTFGELWGSGDEPVIDLEMQTTNVTEGRPYRLPDDLRSGFCFDEAEFRRLFPGRVVDHLVKHAGDVPTAGGLIPLPAPADLPVVVATRMSLSFPILMSAVPLYAVDRSMLACQEETYERSWFSDGGITSNFPISFFDSLLPSRPTFGITLRPFHPCHPINDDERRNVWMPRTNGSGIVEWWSRWPQGRGLLSVGQFLRAIADAMQNWVDNSQTRVPGYRDRIVHISHTDDEGGLNLDMPETVLERLTERGRCAGERLVGFYTNPPGVPLPEADPEGSNPTSPKRVVSWENHRWIRLRTSMALVSDAVQSMGERYDAAYAADLAAPIARAPSYPFNNLDQQALARQLMTSLTQVSAHIRDAERGNPNVPLGKGAPSPAPALKVVPGVRPAPDPPRADNA
jgi:hypothetical protein